MNRTRETLTVQSALAALSAGAAAVGGLGVISYTLGYLSALGSSLKLGLPVDVQQNQALIVHGATLPLGVIANWIIALRQVVTETAVWQVIVAILILAIAVIAAIAVVRHMRVLPLLATFAALVMSLFSNWGPFTEQGLLLNSPAYLSEYDHQASDARQEARQLAKDIDLERASTDAAFRSALEERVQHDRDILLTAQQALAARRDVMFDQHRLVYCTYFRSDARCNDVATKSFAVLSAMTLAIITVAIWQAARGLRLWLAIALLLLCALDVAFLVIDYGWLLGRTEFNLAEADAGQTLVYLGDLGDRYVLFAPASRTLTLRTKSDVPRLKLIGTADVFAEIEEGTGGAGQ